METESFKNLQSQLLSAKGLERLGLLLTICESPACWGILEEAEYLEEAYKISLGKGSQNDTGRVLLSKGKYFERLGEQSATIDSLERAQSLFRESGDEKRWIEAEIILTELETTRANYEPAIKRAEAAYAVAESNSYIDTMANVLGHIGEIHSKQGNYELAFIKNSRALHLRETINDKYGLANSYNSLGVIYRDRSDYPKALEFFKKSIEFREEFGDRRGTAATYNNLRVVYRTIGNIPESLRYFFLALDLRQQLNEKRALATAYNNIGAIYKDQDNLNAAKNNFLIGLKLREELGDKHGMANSYNNLGVISASAKNMEEAYKYFEVSIKLRSEIGDKHGLAGSYAGLGAVPYELGKYDVALENITIASKIYEEVGDKAGISDGLIQAGDVLIALGKHTEALDYIKRGVELAELIGDKDVIIEGYEFLSKCYRAMHDFESALTYYEKFYHTENEMHGKSVQKQLAQINLQRGVELQEKETALEKEKRIIVEEKNRIIEAEKQRSESLLLNILPAEVADELKSTGMSEARLFNEVTVLFTDFKNFTGMSEKLSPKDLVNELHQCFKAFDEIIGKYGLEKIKTVGDAYLAAAGLPLPVENHAMKALNAAIEIRDFMLNRKKALGELTFEVRIGLHSGPVIAGIVGVKKFAYDIWGDTVNTAARMEQNSGAGKINISGATYQLVKDKIGCTYRGEIAAKNKGKLQMYFVN